MEQSSDLESNFYQGLINNRKLLIENISFSKEMINLCIEKKIISGENIVEFKQSKTTEERINCITKSLQAKSSKYFFFFCEVLTLCGQPLIAEILQEYVSKEIEIDIETLLNEIPNLKKSLSPKDKELLRRLINEKVKNENIKAIVTHSKESQRRESISQVNQIQQSWQFQKEIKLKSKESNGLKEQLQSIEEELLQKQNELKLIKTELKEKEKQQEDKLLIASSFNDANDKQLQRTESSLKAYKIMLKTMIEKIKFILKKEDEKLWHESSPQQMKKYDVEKQIQVFEELFEKLIALFNFLSNEMVNYDTLKNEVIETMKLLFPQRESSSSENLTSYTKDFQNIMSYTIKSLESKIDLQDNFILGKIPAEFVPEQYINLEIPSQEREEYIQIIKELKLKVRMLESMLAAKQKDFENYVSEKLSGEKEIFLEESNGKVEDSQVTKLYNSRNNRNNESKKSVIPFSYTSNYKSRPPRVNENKFKKSNVLKVSSVNFL